jgi:hypothetical protein
MTKYTTGKLIEVLENFPKDTPIQNNLCLIWDFPDEIRNTTGFKENPIIYSQENATILGLFEGDWKQEGMDIKAEEFRKNIK